MPRRPPLLRAALPPLLAALAAAHALLAVPNQRGTLRRGARNPNAPDVDPAAPVDHWAHFPAGSKAAPPGAGKRSQQRAAWPRGWDEFRPLRPDFRWRADVCGDEVPGPHHHRRGGQYYHGGRPVATYVQGGTLRAEMNVIAHHNGFIEFHLCNVNRCPFQEISQACFRMGHCVQLRRKWNPKCESRRSWDCAPIDPRYPGRWYLPCPRQNRPNGIQFYGGDSILYELPKYWYGDHFVLQWFWTSANDCNPPGVVDFFNSDRAPFWGTCSGQGGAQGGVTRVQQPCGPTRFAEEYLQCADIRITRPGQGHYRRQAATPPHANLTDLNMHSHMAGSVTATTVPSEPDKPANVTVTPSAENP